MVESDFKCLRISDLKMEKIKKAAKSKIQKACFSLITFPLSNLIFWSGLNIHAAPPQSFQS